ncbi:MAG: N-acetylmuramoyl-L-alanine amidase family protein [Thermodesulfovibrionales bacterium]
MKINTVLTKRVFFLCFAILTITISLSAQKKTDITMKFSSQEGLLRIVFEAAETFITNTKVNTSPSQIRLEFPGPYNLSPKEGLPFRIEIKEKSLVINLEEKGEIKLLKLSNPARLVFDIYKDEKQSAAFIPKIFVLDAGHGGYDFGITSGDLKEKDITLNLVKELEVALSKKGKKVFLTRKVDQYLSLVDRIEFINQKNPDIFLSFHSSSSDGFVIYTAIFKQGSSDEMVDLYSLFSRQKKFLDKSKVLSDRLGEALKNEFQKNVIYREIPLPILNSVGAPAVLIEFPSPKFVTYDQNMRERFIKSILNGIMSYGSRYTIKETGKDQKMGYG